MSEAPNIDKLDVVGENTEKPDWKFDTKDIEAIVSNGNKEKLQANFENLEDEKKQELINNIADSFPETTPQGFSETQIYALQIISRLEWKEVNLDGKRSSELKKVFNDVVEKKRQRKSGEGMGEESSEKQEKMNKDLIEYFDLGEEEIQTIDNLKEKLGFDFESNLVAIKDSIEGLELPEDSVILDKVEFEQIKQNIKELIWWKINSISDIVEEKQNEAKEQNIDFKRMRWVINGEIKNQFWEVQKDILNPLQAYLILDQQSTIDWYRNYLQEEKDANSEEIKFLLENYKDNLSGTK